MNDNKGQTIFLSVIGIATLLVAIIGATFAYFTTTMNGSAANVGATTAKLGEVSYNANGITATDAVLPGWSANDTITLTMKPSDVDVEFNCFINASALGTDDKLEDFYVTSSATAAGTNTIADTIATKRKFAAADKGQKVKIASGTLKGGNTTDNIQTITYTVGFEETGESQNGQQGLAFAAAVTCELKSDQTVYYNQGNKTGTTTKPDAE